MKVTSLNMNLAIKQLEVSAWSIETAQIIQDRISSVLAGKNQCSVMLTGGRSAERLYSIWAELPAFQHINNVQFYFGDERCVPPVHPESNYGMAMRTLFGKGVPSGCSVFRMEADDVNPGSAALRYESRLPEKIDVLLLGVGEDGHVASLFPGSSALQEKTRRVVPVIGTKPPFERITITPSVITQADVIFVLATGPVKAQVLTIALQDVENFDTIPARLALNNATWLLDSPIPKD